MARIILNEGFHLYIERGAAMSYAYVGRKPCGCIAAAIVDLPIFERKEIAAHVSKWIAQGLVVDRVTADVVRAEWETCASHVDGKEHDTGKATGGADLPRAGAQLTIFPTPEQEAEAIIDRAEQKGDETLDDVCTDCDHKRGEHQAGGPCTVAGCACKGFDWRLVGVICKWCSHERGNHLINGNGQTTCSGDGGVCACARYEPKEESGEKPA